MKYVDNRMFGLPVKKQRSLHWGQNWDDEGHKWNRMLQECGESEKDVKGVRLLMNATDL